MANRLVILSVLLGLSCGLHGQNSGYLRALQRNTVSLKWEFVSINLTDGQTAVVAQLPDSLTPFGNGTATAFNPATQRYFYLADSPPPSKRYLVTVDAFSGRVVQAVNVPGVFALYANESDGFVYGIRYITVTQLVRISPGTGATTAITANFNFVFSYSSTGSDLHAQNDELWLIGQQPQNTDRLLRVNLSSAATSSIIATGLRLVRRDFLNGEVYGVRRVTAPSVRFELLSLDPSDPGQQRVLEDSLPIQNISGEVCQINPHIGEMYLRVIQSGNPVLQLAVIGLSDGQIRRFIPFEGKNGIAYTPFPPNLRTHTLSGVVFLDRNANGLRDSADIGMANQRVDIQPGGYRVLTNASGRYAVQVPDGTYTVTPFTTSLYYVSSRPLTYTVPVLSGFSMADTLDFALAIFGGASPREKLSVSVSPSPSRVGQDVQHTVTVKNEGTTVLNGKVTYEEGAHLKVKNTSEPPSQVNNGKFEFDFSNLLPGESRQILITLETPPDPNLIGLDNTAIVRAEATSPGGGMASDVKTVTQKIFGAYDPNDKLVFSVTDTTLSPGDTVSYTVRFQNVGNDTAFLVVIRDTLPISQIDPESFIMDAASHFYFVQIEPDGLVTWTFPNIMLPDSGSNQAGSNGFVAFRVTLKSTLAMGEIVRNKAGIYFDFNPPVITNEALVRMPGTMTLERNKHEVFSIYPNPGNNLLYVVSELPLLPPQVLDLNGKALQSPVTAEGKGYRIATSHLPAGLYLIRVQQAGSPAPVWKRWIKQ